MNAELELGLFPDAEALQEVIDLHAQIDPQGEPLILSDRHFPPNDIPTADLSLGYITVHRNP